MKLSWLTLTVVLVLFLAGYTHGVTAKTPEGTFVRHGNRFGFFLPCDGKKKELNYLYREQNTSICSDGRELSAGHAYVIYRIPLEKGQGVDLVGYCFNNTPFSFDVSGDGKHWRSICSSNPAKGKCEPNNYDIEGASGIQDCDLSSGNIYFRFRCLRYEAQGCPIVKYLAVAFETNGNNRLNRAQGELGFDTQYGAMKIKEDLNFLVKTLEDAHPNVHFKITKDQFLSEMKTIEAKLNHSMTAVEFYKLIAPLVASIGDGHTSLFPEKYIAQMAGMHRLLPIGLANDDIFMMHDRILYRGDDISGLPQNSHIIAINGMSVESINKELRRFFPDEHPDHPFVVNAKFFTLFYAFTHGFPDSYQIVALNQHKRLVSTIEAVSLEDFKRKHARAKNKRPAASSLVFNDGLSTAIIRMDSFGDPPAVKRFVTESFHAITKKSVHNVIIDLRENPGGDSSVGDVLFASVFKGPFRQFASADVKVSKMFSQQRGPIDTLLPAKHGQNPTGSMIHLNFEEKPGEPVTDKIFTGKIFVLVGNHTASSAASLAAMFKDYKRGMIIGEETGGLASSYGDSLKFTLPNTQLDLRVSCKYFCRPNGECTAVGVLPDHAVQQTADDFENGRDTVMEYTLNLIQNSGAK